MARSFRTRRSRAGRAQGIALPAGVREAVRSSGEPLDGEVLALMESGFGHDFSRVRVHADGDAARSAHALGARAYTVDEDVVFGAGAYDPHSAPGRRRIAHELAHVAQQDRAPAPARTLSTSGDADERAADAAAAQVVSGHPAHVERGSAHALVAREEGWSIDPTGGPQPTTNVLQEFDVDKPKGGKPWDLDRLTKQIGEALKGHKDRYIEVVSYHGASADPIDSRESAKKRVDTVKKALLQWIPTLKGRLRVSLRDLGLLSIPPPSRQVSVEWGPFGSLPPGTFDSPLLKPGVILPDEGPLVPKATPLPEGEPAGPEPEPLAPYPGASGTWPAEPLDALKVFFASPPGQKLKAWLKKNGLHAWRSLSTEEKVGLLVSQGLPAFLISYAIATMSDAQRGSLKSILPELDEAALRPLPEKTWNFGLDVDPDFAPGKLRTPLFDWDVPKDKKPGGTALGIDLRIVKAATKTFYKPGESISVSYAVPDEGWSIQMVSDDPKTRAVVETRKIPYPTKDGSMSMRAPDAAGTYTLNLVDGLGGEPKRTVRFRVQ
jgi:hypothetical protein